MSETAPLLEYSLEGDLVSSLHVFRSSPVNVLDPKNGMAAQ
ncbi:MAG: hypothetical protein ACK5LO_07645 [Leucobacter sp.]